MSLARVNFGRANIESACHTCSAPTYHPASMRKQAKLKAQVMIRRCCCKSIQVILFIINQLRKYGLSAIILEIEKQNYKYSDWRVFTSLTFCRLVECNNV